MPTRNEESILEIRMHVGCTWTVLVSGQQSKQKCILHSIKKKNIESTTMRWLRACARAMAQLKRSIKKMVNPHHRSLNFIVVAFVVTVRYYIRHRNHRSVVGLLTKQTERDREGDRKRAIVRANERMRDKWLERTVIMYVFLCCIKWTHKQPLKYTFYMLQNSTHKKRREWNELLIFCVCAYVCVCRILFVATNCFFFSSRVYVGKWTRVCLSYAYFCSFMMPMHFTTTYFVYWFFVPLSPLLSPLL